MVSARVHTLTRISPVRGAIVLGMQLDPEDRFARIKDFYRDAGDIMPAEASGKVSNLMST